MPARSEMSPGRIGVSIGPSADNRVSVGRQIAEAEYRMTGLCGPLAPTGTTAAAESSIGATLAEVIEGLEALEPGDLADDWTSYPGIVIGDR